MQNHNMILHVDSSLEYDREVISRLVSEGMMKIDAYLIKYAEQSDAVQIDVFLKKNSDSSFTGKVNANISGTIYVHEREKIFLLQDLVQSLFQHLKEQLSDK